MLESVDLSQKLSRAYYKTLMPELEIRLGSLQRKAIEAKLPIIILFEGWEGAGKGSLINRTIQSLDPRHFKVHSVQKPNEEERLRPFLWRFWTRTPAAGRLTIFDRSWYHRVLHDRVDKTVSKAEWVNAYDEINAFEQQLVSGGYLIIKLFLHISKKEQRRRYEKLEQNPSTAWRITKHDWTHHRRYDKYAEAAEDMFARTSPVPWYVVEAMDRRFATVKIFQIVSEAVDNALASRPAAAQPLIHSEAAPIDLAAVEEGGTDVVATADEGQTSATDAASPESLTHAPVSLLAASDLSQSVTREEYSKRLKRYQSRMHTLEHEIYARRVPVVIVYEGWDAAGKGGNIRRITQSMDPRGYDVIPVAAPSDIEKRHHYLWRFWRDMPKAGHVAIFDRSWYGRVLVERVEGFCTEEEWRRSYEEINEMERHIASYGTVLIKFWVHIDKQTQMRRFKEREKIEYKRWKITDEDYRNREKWDNYLAAVEDMLKRTSTEHAPWTVIESNSKHFARLKALRTVINAIERRL
jgi:polyphosphate kinase 2 (PPK2 family)